MQLKKLLNQVLVDGYRTGDIYREGLKRVGTTEMAQVLSNVYNRREQGFESSSR